jgi:hypothetical protein
MAQEKSKPMSVRPALWVAGGSALSWALVWTGWGIYLYWNDVRLVNFLAAWIPFVLSTLLAFVPEHKMTTTKKWLWRSSVMLVGLSWSVVLWHQQVVTDETARKDQENMVISAVTKANEHSDQKIESVKKDVGGVKTDVGGVKSDLKDATDALTGLLSKNQSEITSGLSKVGKPDPPETVRFQASLWPDSADVSWPIVKRTIAPNADGNIPVDVTFRNISGTSVSNADIWIELAPHCTFVSEPEGFDRPAGQPESTRHRVITLINPGVTMAKMTLMIKVEKPFTTFDIAFRYSCQWCTSGLESQHLWITQGYKPLG